MEAYRGPVLVTFMAPTWHEPRHALRLRSPGDQVWLDKAVSIVFNYLLTLFLPATFSFVLSPIKFQHLDAQIVITLPSTTNLS